MDASVPLEANLQTLMERALRVVGDHGATGPRLLSDAQRLWKRIQALGRLNKLSAESDYESLELTAYALQLPLRRTSHSPTGRSTRSTLRDRAEESAQLLVSEIAGSVDELLLDRAARLLLEMPHRSPMLEEARLLADALNLEDFGVIGIVQYIIQLCHQGQGVSQFAEGMEKREQYQYWQARLKDGFHFDPVRQIAQQRLAHAREIVKLLEIELKQDNKS